MKKRIITISLVVVMLAGAFAFSGFLAGKKELPPQRPKPQPVNYVKVEEVYYQAIPIQIEALGRVQSSQRVDLIAEVGGKLEPGAVQLEEGQRFRRGQVLANVNNREQVLNLQARKSNFLNLLAIALADVKIDHPEAYEEWNKYFLAIDMEKELAPLPAVSSAKLKTYLATSNVLSEYYSIKSLEENLTKYQLRAPYNGSVLGVALEIGSVVSPGARVATLIRTDRLELKVPVLKDDIKYVEIGKEVKLLEESSAQEWTGRVSRIADFIDPNNQSINVYVQIDNRQADIYDGLYLKALIPGKIIEAGMAIDRKVIRNKDQVFVVQDSVLSLQQVEVAKISQEEAVIGGLPEGTPVVVDAPANAAENMKVKIAN